MKLNQPICATAYGNTGFGDCFLEPSKIIGMFQVPSNFEISEADLVDLQEFLTTKVHAAIGTRIFPYHQFIGITDNTEDVTINTTDYGSKIFIRDGYYDFTFRYQAGGVLAHQEFGKNEGSGKYFLFYDDNNVIYGYNKNGKLTGIPTELFKVLPWRPATGAEATQYLMRVIINPLYMNKGNLSFAKIENFNFFDILGLQDVKLELIGLASNVATVKAYTRVSAVDLHDAYGATFAASGAWRAENEDGTAIAISSVTNNTAEGAWDITLGSPFATSDKAYLKLALPATLKTTYNVEGFDSSQSLEIEAPGS